MQIKRIVEIQSLAPMYLVQSEETGMYGLQLSNERFHIEPVYPLDEEYDFSKNYSMAGLSSEGKIFLIESEGKK